jgi:hypothetical protein
MAGAERLSRAELEALALVRARRAGCPVCHGKPLAADIYQLEDGSHPPDLPEDRGALACSGCGARAYTTVYVYGDAREGGWRPLIGSETDPGAVSEEQVRQAILEAFSAPWPQEPYAEDDEEPPAPWPDELPEEEDRNS